MKENNFDKNSFREYCITTKYANSHLHIYETLLIVAITTENITNLNILLDFFNINDNIKYHDLIVTLYFYGLVSNSQNPGSIYLYNKYRKVFIDFSPKDVFNLDTNSDNNKQKIENSLIYKIGIQDINNKLDTFHDGDSDKFNMILYIKLINFVKKYEPNTDLEEFYEILDIKETDKTNFEIIKKNYRIWSLKNHPDRKPKNGELFKFVSSIYNKINGLIDPVINLEGGRHKKRQKNIIFNNYIYINYIYYG